MDDAGNLTRVLDHLDSGLMEVRGDIKKLDAKIDEYRLTTVTKADFAAYQELQREVIAARRANVKWAIGTIISVLLLLTAFATIIIQTRPEVIVQSLGA